MQHSIFRWPFQTQVNFQRSRKPPADLVSNLSISKNRSSRTFSAHIGRTPTRFFVTFRSDNHDWKERIHFVDPANPTRFDDQVNSRHCVSFTRLPGHSLRILREPEFGLRGSGTDEAVRGSTLGPFELFPKRPFSISTFANIGKVRAARSEFCVMDGSTSVQFWRTGSNFAITTATQGVLAFSRILNGRRSDQSLQTTRNSAPNQTQAVDVIVDGTLQPAE